MLTRSLAELGRAEAESTGNHEQRHEPPVVTLRTPERKSTLNRSVMFVYWWGVRNGDVYIFSSPSKLSTMSANAWTDNAA
jgi:hypothetical protein